MSEDTKNIREVVKKPLKKKKTKPKTLDILSSGSTLMNLACTNNPFGAFLKGKYVYLVGDSTSGKTFLSMSCLAEAGLHTTFKDYDFYYDNVEDGMEMDLQRLFGSTVAEKLQPPKMEKGVPVYSYTIEEFYYHLEDSFKKSVKNNTPFIYILDSMDGLSSDAAEDKFDEQKSAHEKNKEITGTYGDGKAKKNSQGVRRLLKGLRDTGSILVIISQTRDKLTGYGGKGRSGGHALKFYATHEIWTSVKEDITRTIKGKERSIGTRVKVQVRKNRATGERHEVQMDIYPSYGIDDVGACIDYLLSEKWWEKIKASIVAEEFDITCSKPKLISHIEENGLERKLQIVTGRCWREIQKEKALTRTPKYKD